MVMTALCTKALCRRMAIASVPANEDVSTTRLTVSRLFATAPSTTLVPFTAGSTRSRCLSSTFLAPARGLVLTTLLQLPLLEPWHFAFHGLAVTVTCSRHMR